MLLLGDEAQLEARFGPFGDSDARSVHGLRRTYLMELLADVGHVESSFGLFGDGVCVSVI